jgi:hypothetical protein
MLRLVSLYSFLMLFFYLEAFSQEQKLKYPLPSSLNYTNLKITDAPKKNRDSCLTFPLEYGEDTLDYLACLNNINIDYFYPIGWSRGGAFAYAQLVDVDGELPTYKMLIINSPIKATSTSNSIPVGFSPAEDFDDVYDFWVENKNDVDGLMELHHIRSNTISYKPITKLRQNSKFKLELVPKKGKIPFGEGTFVYQYQIKLNLDKGKERILYKYEYLSVQRKIDEINIVGIIQSPFEKKAVLVLSSREWVDYANQNLTFKLIVINW